MQDSLELKNTKGYRAKYINALNDAVKQTRIVGGDVEPVEAEGGTHLYMRGWADQGKFQLFAGVAPLNDNLYNVRAVSDGCFFASGQFIKLRNARNTYYVKGGLMPRGSGWYNGVAPSSWVYCRVVILAYGAEYFLAFRFDSTPLWELIDGATEADEENISVICTIGEWNNTTKTVTQYISTDIFYGGEGGGTVEAELQPWEIFSTSEVNEQTGLSETVWWVAHPIWELDAPFTDYPAESYRPVPESAIAFDVYWGGYETKEIKGMQCWRLYDVLQSTCAAGTQNIYAVININGVPTLYAYPPDLGIVETPACILLGTMSEDGTWRQTNKGVLRSFWRETTAFYLESGSCGVITRHSSAPTNLAEGTTMLQYSFWFMETYLDGTLIKSAEQLNYNPAGAIYPYPQEALLYGNWIWRYNLHFRANDNAVIRDELTTPVANVTASHFARIIEQPYVERIEVVYPETPLDQGEVNEVHATIKVLAVDTAETETTNLFRTETIDATEGGIIEVTQ